MSDEIDVVEEQDEVIRMYREYIMELQLEIERLKQYIEPSNEDL